MIGTLRGKACRYVGKEARCVNCGAQLFVPDFLDYNLRTLYDAYRKENNIVSLEQIREIPEKYAVGERPLSLLLGWGERDFSRYADGDIPTKQRSDILIRLYNDPAFFARLLKTDKAHENIRKEQQ